MKSSEISNKNMSDSAAEPMNDETEHDYENSTDYLTDDDAAMAHMTAISNPLHDT